MSGGAGVLNLGGSFTIASTSGGRLLPGTTSTFNYNGAAQTVVGGVTNFDYANLTLSGSGTKTMPATAMTIAGSFALSGAASATAGAALTVNGAFSVGSGTTFSASTFSHAVKGNFSNNGTFTAGTSTVTFSGTSAQTIGGSNPTTFSKLTISNAVGVSLSGVDATVGSILELNNRILTTGANKVIASSTVSRTGATTANGFVNGNLQKPVATGTSSPVFEVGSATKYAPIGLASLVVTVAGNLTASTTAGQQPNYGSSGLSATRYVNRYWTLTAGGGLAVSGYNATFTFVNPGDLVGTTASPNNILKVKRFVGPSTWSAPTSTTSTTTTATGTTFGTTFGDYAVGE